jgi:hypothetical protein
LILVRVIRKDAGRVVAFFQRLVVFSIWLVPLVSDNLHRVYWGDSQLDEVLMSLVVWGHVIHQVVVLSQNGTNLPGVDGSEFRPEDRNVASVVCISKVWARDQQLVQGDDKIHGLCYVVNSYSELVSVWYIYLRAWLFKQAVVVFKLTDYALISINR